MNARVCNLESEFKPLGSGAEELTVADAVVSLQRLPEVASHGMLSVKTQPLHVAFDADPASAGAGILLPVGTIMILPREAIAKARFIRSAGSNGAVRCEPGNY